MKINKVSVCPSGQQLEEVEGVRNTQPASMQEKETIKNQVSDFYYPGSIP